MNLDQINFKTKVFCSTKISTTNLITSLSTTTINKQEKDLQINLKNIGKDTSVNSICIDFKIPNYKITEILENGWGQSSFSSYINKITPTKKNKIILVRDQNPYSFKKDFTFFLSNFPFLLKQDCFIEYSISLILGLTSKLSKSRIAITSFPLNNKLFL